MPRLSPRHLLGTLVGTAALAGLAIFASLGGDRVAAPRALEIQNEMGEMGKMGGSRTPASRSSMESAQAGFSGGLASGPASDGATFNSDGLRSDDASDPDAPARVRLLAAPGGRLELDPLLQGFSSSIGLAPPGTTSANIDLRRVTGALGLDQLGALSHGLLGVIVDDDGLTLSFDPGVVVRTWSRVVGTIAEWWNSGVRHAAEAQVQASQWAMTWFDGNRPVPPPSDSEMPNRAILLVHAGVGDGEEWSNVWEDLLPALCEAGQMAVQFEYSRQESLPVAADGLGEALTALRAHGVDEVDLVAHSDGGLVVRDVLTRPSWYASRADGGTSLPRVRRAILVGTPNHGAVLAGSTLAAEAATAATAATRRGSPPHARTLSRQVVDGGMGHAAEPALDSQQVSLGALAHHARCVALELGSDSPYLAELNARPLPAGVALTIIAGRSLGRDAERERAIPSHSGARRAPRPARGDAAGEPGSPASAGGWLGDGLVTLDSAMLPGVQDVVVLPGGHRSLLVKRRAGEVPPAVPVILERLSDGW